MTEPSMTERDASYLEQVEQLAQAVADAANAKDWFTFSDDVSHDDPLRQAIHGTSQSQKGDATLGAGV